MSTIAGIFVKNSLFRTYGVFLALRYEVS